MRINPAAEDWLDYVSINRAVHRIAVRFRRLNMSNGSVALFPIGKRNHEEILVLAVFVGIHDRMMTALQDRPRCYDQTIFLHQRRKLIQSYSVVINIDPWCEIKTCVHMKHCAEAAVSDQPKV